MERVAFLIEDTQERISCLLNPESLVMRRRAGVRPRPLATGQLASAPLQEDPILFTGGGRTELELDLLFDVTLAGSTIHSEDVRDYTRPLWEMAQRASLGRSDHPPVVRFIWGKAWNIPAIIVALAERLEDFSAGGAPRRSWLRLRLWRVDPEALTAAAPSPRALADAIQLHSRVSGNMTSVGIQLPGGLPPDVSILDAFLTAGDIITRAVAETPMGNQLVAWGRQLMAWVQDWYEGLRTWWNTPSHSPLLDTLRDALNWVKEGAEHLLHAAGERIMEGALWAQGKLHAAMDAISEALTQLRKDVEEATAPARAWLRKVGEAIMANVGPIVRALPQAASVIAQAVRAKAQRAIAILAPAIARRWRQVKQGLSSLAEGVWEGLGALGQRMKEAMQTLDEAWERFKEKGLIPGLALVGAALDTLVQGADALWSLGRRAVTRMITQGAGVLARLFKNLAETGKALLAAGAHAAARAQTALIDGFSAALARALEGGEATVRFSARILQETGSGLAAGGKLLTSLLPHDASGSWRAALTALQHQLSRLASTPAPEEEEATISLPREEAEAIQESLQQAQQALADLQAREEEQRARIVQQAAVLSPRTTSAPDALSLAPEAGPGASPGPGKVQQMGERLDELAYRYYGSPRFWRVLARTNAIQHPLHLPPHLQLQLPPILPEPGAAF